MAAYPDGEEYPENNILESLPNELYGKIQEFLTDDDLYSLLATSRINNQLHISNYNRIIRECGLIGKDKSYWGKFIGGGGSRHVECYQYFVEALGITLDDIIVEDNNALQGAAENGHYLYF